MQTQQLHDDDYFRVSWDDDTRVISIDWKEATSAMTDEDFKSELELFAALVGRKKAQGILVDVTHFRHTIGPEAQEWRVKNISGRYFAAGVRRFAFLFPAGASVPPAMNESVPSENFVTRAFNDPKKAMTWLTQSD